MNRTWRTFLAASVGIVFGVVPVWYCLGHLSIDGTRIHSLGFRTIVVVLTIHQFAMFCGGLVVFLVEKAVPESQTRSSIWVRRHGSWILVSSRQEGPPTQ